MPGSSSGFLSFYGTYPLSDFLCWPSLITPSFLVALYEFIIPQNMNIIISRYGKAEARKTARRVTRRAANSPHPCKPHFFSFSVSRICLTSSSNLFLLSILRTSNAKRNGHIYPGLSHIPNSYFWSADGTIVVFQTKGTPRRRSAAAPRAASCVNPFQLAAADRACIRPLWVPRGNGPVVCLEPLHFCFHLLVVLDFEHWVPHLTDVMSH